MPNWCWEMGVSLLSGRRGVVLRIGKGLPLLSGLLTSSTSSPGNQEHWILAPALTVASSKTLPPLGFSFPPVKWEQTVD